VTTGQRRSHDARAARCGKGEAPTAFALLDDMRETELSRKWAVHLFEELLEIAEAREVERGQDDQPKYRGNRNSIHANCPRADNTGKRRPIPFIIPPGTSGGETTRWPRVEGDSDECQT
jgi:hypothetical protein